MGVGISQRYSLLLLQIASELLQTSSDFISLVLTKILFFIFLNLCEVIFLQN